MTHTTTTSRPATANGFNTGFAGFLVGSIYAAAGNIQKVKNGEMDKAQAISASLKEGGKTGLATGGAAILTSVLGLPSIFGAVAFAAAGCGIKYWLDNINSKDDEDEKVETQTTKKTKKLTA